jgi:hypothetical protein
MDKPIKYGAIAVAVSLVLASTITWATAQEIQSGTGLICDTAAQLERFVALAKTESTAEAAIQSVNTEVGDSHACGVATIRFLVGEEIGRVDTFEIVSVLVVAINDGEKWYSVGQPQVQFTIVEPDGLDV